MKRQMADQLFHVVHQKEVFVRIEKELQARVFYTPKR